MDAVMAEPYPRLIVALIGQSVSERSRVALAMMQQQPEAGPFKQIDFSDALYQEVASAYGLKPEEVIKLENEKKEMFALRYSRDDAFVRVIQFHLYQQYDLSADELRELPDLPQSPRQIIEWWHDVYRSGQDSHYWASRLQYRLNEDPKQNFVVADSNGPAEVSTLRSLGFKLVQVRNENEHSSDQEQFDYVINACADDEMLQLLVSGLIDVIALASASNAPATDFQLLA